MEPSELRTVHLRRLLDRIQEGDAIARDELIRRSMNRLERLARKMLKGFPKVRRWEDTLDVLQNALVRLLRSLEKKRPESTRDFFNLAANRIRSELLDLARHYQGPMGLGANHASGIQRNGEEPDSGCPALDPADPAPDSEELDRWCAFHQAVERLPEEEREVVGLVFYHGCTQVEIAELFQVNERTIRRRWQAACLRLHELLGNEVPSV